MEGGGGCSRTGSCTVTTLPSQCESLPRVPILSRTPGTLAHVSSQQPQAPQDIAVTWAELGWAGGGELGAVAWDDTHVSASATGLSSTVLPHQAVVLTAHAR